MQANQQVAAVLGQPQSALAPSQQATTNTISGMSPKQLFKILKELKAQMQADPEKGRMVLRQNMVLTKALFQAQILLGMVNPDQPPMGRQGGSAPPPAPQTTAQPQQPTQGAAHPVPNHEPAMIVNQEDASQGNLQQPPATGQPNPTPDSSIAGVPPAQLEMMRKVIRLTPAEISALNPEQRKQVDQVRAYVAKKGIQL